MAIINHVEKYAYNTILDYLPKNIRASLYNINFNELEEIRLRINRPVRLHFRNTSFFISPSGALVSSPVQCQYVCKKDIDEAMSLITSSSVYALQHQISQGYITLPKGHRVGLCGSAVLENDKVSFIKDICGLNYRFAHEINSCADKVIKTILCGNIPLNTLIISPPQCGKTTMLRDIIRQISNMGIKVSVVDERSEIAAMTNAVPGFDLGINTDILDNCTKATGINILLRSMSPEVIALDELGSPNDISAVQNAIYCGVKIIATIHAFNRYDLLNRFDIHKLYEQFDCIITLSKKHGSGSIDEIYIR